MSVTTEKKSRRHSSSIKMFMHKLNCFHLNHQKVSRKLSSFTHPSPTTTHLMACIVALRLCYPKNVVDYPSKCWRKIRLTLQLHKQKSNRDYEACQKSPTPPPFERKKTCEWNRFCFSRCESGSRARRMKNVGDQRDVLNWIEKKNICMKVSRLFQGMNWSSHQPDWMALSLSLRARESVYHFTLAFVVIRGKRKNFYNCWWFTIFSISIFKFFQISHVKASIY